MPDNYLGNDSQFFESPPELTPEITSGGDTIYTYVQDFVTALSAVVAPGWSPQGEFADTRMYEPSTGELKSQGLLYEASDSQPLAQRVMKSVMGVLGYNWDDPADRKAAAPIIAGGLGAVLMGVGGGITASQNRKMRERELEQLKPLQMAQTGYYNAKAADEQRRTANQDFSKMSFTGLINKPFKPAPIAPLYSPR